MSNYRRLFIPNSYLFLTITTNYRRPILIDNINLLKQAFKNTKEIYHFEIFASVILPEHIHSIIIPDKIEDYPKIIHAVKYSFSKKLQNGGIVIPPYNLSNSKLKKGDKGIWQRRHYEHTIRDEDDLHKHLDYIHYNPVKHGLTQNVKNWEFSSFNKFVKMGNYDENWGSHKDIEKIKNLNYE